MATKFLGGIDVSGDFLSTTPPLSDNSTRVATTAFVKGLGYLTSLPTHTHSWTEITGKPSTFTPSAHTHSISDVTGLQTALDGKQPAGSYLTSIPAEYLTQDEADSLYQVRGSYASESHTHTFASITSKPTTLSGYGITDAATSAQGTKADTAHGWGNHALAGYLTSGSLSGYATQSYVNDAVAGVVNSAPERLDTLRELAQALGDDPNFATTITDLIAGKANASHTHTIAQVTGLQTALDGKQAAGSYAAASHGHTIENITGLQSALDDKQPRGSYLTSLGFSYSTGVNGSHVVQRDGNGYIYANHINFSTGEAENPSINSFFVSNGDGWSRKASVAHVKSQLGLGSAAYASTGSFVASNGSSWTPHPSSGRDASFNTFYTDYGYIQFGPANSSWAHIYSNKNFYFNQNIYVNDAKLATESYVTSRGYITSVPAQSWSSITSKPADWLNATNLVQGHAPGGRAQPSGFYESYLGSGNPTGTWFNYVNVRHSNPDNGHGFQAGMSYYDNNFWFRSYQGGVDPSFQEWEYAISNRTIGSQSVNYANSAGSVAWGNVSGRPSALSSFTNDLGNYGGWITSDGRAYPRRADGTNINFYWDGQGGQPTWLWGSNNGSDFYVWNPSNFSVNYAASAGSAANFSGTINGDVRWNGGANFLINGESSFDLTSGGQWGVWESQTASWWIRANWGDHLRLVENGKNVYVYGSRLYNDSGQQAVFQNGGTWSISVSGNASTASNASNADALGGIGVGGFLRDDGWNTYPGQDANTQGTMRSDFTYSNNAPFTGELIRFGASGYSLQLNSSYGGSNLAYRTNNGDRGTSWNEWYTIIDSGNIGSQSVNYASSAGNADTLDGYHASVAGSANTIPTRNANGYLIPENWIQLNGIYGLYSPTNNAHLRPNPNSYGSWLVTGSRNGWAGIEFDVSNGNVTLMLLGSGNVTGFHNNSYGWQMRWEGGTIYCNKNSYGGGTQAVVLDSSNWTSYVSIPSQLVTGNNQSASLNSSKFNIYNNNFTEAPVELQLNADSVLIHNRMAGTMSFRAEAVAPYEMQLTAEDIRFQGTRGGWAPIICEYVSQVSDINLKHEIQTISSALEKVNQLRGVEFLWKSNDQPSIGFIAQEVEEVVPVAVSNRSGTKTIDYSKIIPILTQAIKEQQDQINILMQEIQLLKTK